YAGDKDVFTFTATLNNPVQGGLTAAYVTNDGTATTADNDYLDNDGNLLFTGTAGETKTFTVASVADNKVEANETFQTVLTGLTLPVGITSVTIAGSPQTATIVNDEVDFGDAPDTYGTLLASSGARHSTVLGFRLGNDIDGEVDGQPTANASGDGADEDGVTLPSPLVTNTTANVTVNASLAGKLDAWVDFNNNGNFNDAGEKVFNNVSVAAGANSLSFAVPNGATPSLTFARFRLSSAGGLSPTGSASDGEVEDYQVQIVNTQFSVNDPTVTEGNAGTTNLAFVITRSNNASACSIDYAITGGTATTADNDYQPLAAGTASFTAGGALTQTINVVVVGDVKVELNETVDMTLSNPVNGSILDGSGTGTIVNDDQGVITITNATVTEGDVPNTVTATFTVNLSNPSDANVAVNYVTVDNTATLANNDFQSASGTLTYTPGQTSKTVTVTVVGDCAIEANETFFLRLSGLVNNGRNVILSGGGATLDGTGTINNDDALPVITCPANLTVNAAAGVCNATVTLPLPTTSSVCGASTLEFRYRTVDANNVPTGAFTAYAPAASNTVNFIVERYEVEWRVTDGSGSSSCSFFLVVRDIQPPTITCPANQNIPASANCMGTVGTWSPVALNDNCAPPPPSVFQTPSSSTVLSGHNDSELVTLTATDEYGNTASCSFTVTLKDVTPPVAKCKNATINLGSGGNVTVAPASVDNGTTDNCGFTLMLTPNTFTCANIGANLVTLKATDNGGNTSTCTATVTIKDLTPPTALCKNINVFLDNTGHASITASSVNNGSFDACGIATMSIDISQFDCGQLGGTPVTVKLTLKDLYNNQSSCLAYVTVKDAIAPTAVCSDMTVSLSATGYATVMTAPLAAGSYDNCSVTSYSPVAKVYTTANIGVNNLTITVKDFSNNSATCVSQVTVKPYNSNNLVAPQNGDAQYADPVEALAGDNETLDLNVFPNPTSGQSVVLFRLPEEQPYYFRLFDLNGRLIMDFNFEGFAGENSVVLELGELPSGMYILDVQSDSLRGQKRIQVQK
ncbi:MAG TPA: Calx-beta domain-containing protein, partial [Saprospiraceae bacterium]|nr:Calx-beta domain-containing protein [Saprospiraceae bacterium]